MIDADSNSASRPKIHRLPQPQTEHKNSRLYVSRTVVILCITGLVVVVLPGLWLNKNPVKARIEQVMSSPVPGYTPDGSDSKSINLGDDSGKIVGQLTKIPATEEQSAKVKTTTNVDSNTGKELLKIISKY